MRAVGSCLAQTHQDVEVLVYDDGSADETPELLAACDDPRLRVWRSEENRGVGCAFRFMQDNARGDYACWLGSDDVSSPYRVEFQLFVQQQFGPAFVRSALMHVEDIPDDRRPLPYARKTYDPAANFWNARRAVRVDPRIRAGEDGVWQLEMWLRYGPALFLPIVLYYKELRRVDHTSVEGADCRAAEKYAESLAVARAKRAELRAEIDATGAVTSIHSVPDWVVDHLMGKVL